MANDKPFWKKLIMEEDAPARDATSAGVAAPPLNTGTGSTAFSGADFGAFAPAPQPSEMFKGMLDTLKKSVFRSDQATAYQQLLALSEKMKRSIPDDATRLRAAVEASGVSANDIIASLDTHLSRLEAAKSSYEADRATNRKSKIDAKKARQQELATERQQLVARMAQLDQESQALISQIAAHENVFAQADTDFQTAYSQVSRELQDTKSRIGGIFAALGVGAANG